ncbi:type I methionyl aminopeptidase [Heyndrickxia oleronia]|jgi:methionyl aminopeptidase|uniref:Methionine aminopeptidase n=1 Tax=Heyndrickxia oleronia TaxID=38875 RepID=A0A8E2IAV5_9BACI|nr:type I methionyl aminopeptidase [Heyndrickxia oleronia]OJH18282.1 type I methionyl aminopeptidase [Bacillus obstructivus]MCI1591395.1 type I methionyl aminopeptidase [Heyndrickxia oleronia]MCI1613877.1 type I methionyl aminopeptidase [Heyndrickxia oleronia]MCI1745007.1 type I methionyl aminopeptidase [Heyndrickxia oleronia]MCI1761777.1 type I methionyl aminopeptidase [Heyndrickxia oleronia]
MIVKNEKDLEALKKIGKIVAEIRDELKSLTKPGVTTKELDERAGQLFESHGAISGPKGEYDFPGYTCISVNDEVAHGIPSDRMIMDGDLVNIDVSGSWNGYYADTGISFVVGESSPELEELCNCAQRAFQKGLAKIKAGSKQNQIGKAVMNEAKRSGFNVILNLTGHGVGRALHEKPDYIMNYYEPWDNDLLKDGMVIAFEPFISTGAEEVVEMDDGWTYKTPDGSLVAQVEHTIIVTKEKPIILTL